MAVASDGRILAAWYSTDSLGGTIGGDRDILYAGSELFVCGDADNDGDFDLADFAGLQECWGQAASPGAACEVFDFDLSGHVGPADFTAFAGLLAGPQE